MTPAPKLVIAVFNTHCNYRCSFCANRLNRSHCKMWTMDQIKALDSLWQGVEIANIGGVGEMSIVPYFDDLLEYFEARGVKTAFTSNGYMLDPEMVHRHDASVWEVVVSLHSLIPEVYDRLTGTTGRHATVIQHIKELAAKPRSYHLTVVSVVTNLNVMESENLAKFVIDVGADEMRFLPLASVQLVGLPKYDDDIPLKETPEQMACLANAQGKAVEAGCRTTQILKVSEREAVVRERMPTCPNPWNEVIITIEGEVLPCCFIHHVFGNIYTTPWEKIWNSPDYDKFRADVKAGTCELCLKNCKNWG